MDLIAIPRGDVPGEVEQTRYLCSINYLISATYRRGMVIPQVFLDVLC